LHVEGRISPEDAARQERTAREILKRLRSQPGLVLADEVGMGKTFVALAVAVSVALSNRRKRPVVVMVPPSLKEKWPADFEMFREKCLPRDLADRVKYGRAERAAEFLKLLDDPPERKKAILFVTHGAMSRGLTDRWVMLALIYQALRKRRGISRLRTALTRIMPQLLHMGKAKKYGPELWGQLLENHPSRWLDILHEWGVDPEWDNDPTTDDDPVPRAVWEVLPRLRTDKVFEALQGIPLKQSRHFDDRLQVARSAIREELRSVWQECVRSLRLRLPLLILDEAHHLKNPDTRLASLFQVADAHDDAEEIRRGPLAGVFERMLFLTATPFQLGHAELCSVLERFGGISWRSRLAPTCGREGFSYQLRDLRTSLDAAQESAVTLDTTWELLRHEDLLVGGKGQSNVDMWWQAAKKVHGLTPATEQVVRCYRRTQERMKAAERLLRPWVIRHLKPRHLLPPNGDIERRRVFPGRSICGDGTNGHDMGIPVAGNALLPFLLAARATSCAPDSRPVFAEGLASSYEAFLQTRLNRAGVTDIDDDLSSLGEITNAARWYLDQLQEMVPRGDPRASASHPKVSATVRRVVDTWRAGEKVVVFCHYVATGRMLRQRISEAIDEQIKLLGAEKLGCDLSDVPGELERIGKRFFDEDSPVRLACDVESSRILREFSPLRQYKDELLEIVRRNVRTPSFLVRFFPLERERLTADTIAEAMDARDHSGLTLRSLLRFFFEFLVVRCGKQDRHRYIDAVNRIQTGSYFGSDITRAFTPDELQGEKPERLVPNVRLVNGTTKTDTRQRLMLTFNTPFYPEILVASSVMAEGVDLHLNCRYVIHHDLCWNPSTLEQRTGRIDRIGAKVEHCGQPIHVYLPYISETQDEKMYRVVMDRARWFSVVMGEDYKIDARTTERLANRIPLPESVAAELAFRLEVASYPG
jgi:superfamily II DNA or RNA helicase